MFQVHSMKIQLIYPNNIIYQFFLILHNFPHLFIILQQCLYKFLHQHQKYCYSTSIITTFNWYISYNTITFITNIFSSSSKFSLFNYKFNIKHPTQPLHIITPLNHLIHYNFLIHIIQHHLMNHYSYS